MFPSPTPHDESAPSASPATSQATAAVHEMLASFFQQQPHSFQAETNMPMIPTAAASPVHPLYSQQLIQQQQQLNAEAMAKAAVSASFLAFLQQAGCPQPPLVQPQPQQKPTYVNAKQYNRILKRRQTRSILDEHYQRQIQQRRRKDQSYQHESRHRHAKKRPRDSHGRFLKGQALLDYYLLHPEEAPQPPDVLDASQTISADEQLNLQDPLAKKIKTEEVQDPIGDDAKPAAKDIECNIKAESACQKFKTEEAQDPIVDDVKPTAKSSVTKKTHALAPDVECNIKAESACQKFETEEAQDPIVDDAKPTTKSNVTKKTHALASDVKCNIKAE